MISFTTETQFEFLETKTTSMWLSSIISQESHREGEVSFVFCTDNFLHKLNVEFLKHDTFTDVISFDYSVGNEVHGEVFISVERVRENATEFNQSLETELFRVMAHGVLHFCGYKDKTEAESFMMRNKEDFYLEQLMDKPF